MKKSTITRTWVGGLVLFAAGVVVSIIGIALMLSFGGTFAQVAGTNDYHFTPDMSPLFWSTVGVTVFGGMVTLVGGIVQLAAWIGALVNSYMLPSKAWFGILLAGGLLSFAFAPLGFAAMLAYVVGAPDGELYAKAPAPALPRQMPMAPTT